MDIDNHLITLLFDFFEEFCTINGESSEEFDKRFVDNEGHEIQELDYFFRHRDELITPHLMDAIYAYLIEDKSPTSDNIINHLLSHYYVYNYGNGSNPVIKYLRNTDLKGIKELLYTNPDFGMDLVTSYFRHFGNVKNYDTAMESIRQNKDEETLDKFNINNIISVKTLSEISREVVTNLFDYYISIGTPLSDALDLVWEYFISDVDPLNDLEKIGITGKERFFYKRLILGTIIGDVYEDICNKPVIQERNEKDYEARIIPIILTDIGIPAIPGDKEIRHRVLNHFIVLQRLDDKKKDNRKATYAQDRIQALKKVNPLYKIDELTL